MTVSLSRRGMICNQAAPPRVTGIDFVQVADPDVQTEILVFFLVDPDLVVVDSGPPQVLMADLSGGVPRQVPKSIVTIATAEGSGAAVPAVQSTAFDRVTVGGATRTVLRVTFDAPGDFVDYVLTVNRDAIDPLFNNAIFSFKQGCPTGFDCEAPCECGDEAFETPEIDYLARDFESFNASLHDFTRRRYPGWAEHLTADAGSMMLDLFAALGDEFAYIQDRFAREAFLETATQRRSLHRLTSLVDYRPDPGRNAAGTVALTMRPSPAATPAIRLDFAERLPVWAVPSSGTPIGFELGNGLADTGSLHVHSEWSRMAIHLPDPAAPCLERGATGLYLAPGTGNVALPRQSQLPAGATPEEFWLGRTMILASDPTDPSVERRVHAVRITAIARLSDPLVLNGGNPSRITWIGWDKSEALPFEMRIAETRVYGNIAPISAGLTVTERFRVGLEGSDDPGIIALPKAVEREGILDQNRCERDRAVLHGLRASETAGLSFAGEHGITSHRIPEIELTEISDLGAIPALSTPWFYRDSLLDADEDDPYFTVEHGMWREIVRYQRGGTFLVHQDYAGDFGCSIRFGSGAFGRLPATDSLYQVRFRTFSGAASNVAPRTVRTLDPPDRSPRKAAMNSVADVVNFFPTEGGLDAETDEDIRIRAPQYYRLFPLRAVRDEDYRAIIERLDWVQSAGAAARWTGSWLTEFVTADPLGAVALSEPRFEELVNLADQIRQAGRDVIVRQPRFAPLDIDITICIAAGFYGGQVREQVLEALVGNGRDGFFAPDRFTFGDPLRRSALEAAVQAVPGVRGVTAIRIRPRGVESWRSFDEPEYPVAVNELLRVDNDKAAPGNGVVTVRETMSGGAP